MKKALLLSCLLAAPAMADMLETPNFAVEIDVTCETGEMNCKAVNYHGVLKKTGKGITLVG